MSSESHPLFHSEDDLFYFESDHLALRGNKDYSDVLKTVLLLTVQREKAIKDYNKVCEIKKEALNDPSSVLQKIKSGEDLGIPSVPDIPKLPVINFDKFDLTLPQNEIKLIYSETVDNYIEDNNLENKKQVKQWTPEEQKRLEELLITYPPEPIEMKRFQKIANALRTRTVQQVCSRVQKYFLKLYKAGLPIPGRVPKYCEKKKHTKHLHQRNNHYLWKPTTFFPELIVPVTINEDDNIPGPSNCSQASTSTSGSSNYLLPCSYQNSTETSPKVQKSDNELQLELLKRIKQEKRKEYSDFLHSGYKCDYCDEEPIIGSRWHCIICTESVDFCTDCVLAQMYSENCHPLSHKLLVYDSFLPSLENNSDSEFQSGCGFSSNENDSNLSPLKQDAENTNGSNSDADFSIKQDSDMDLDGLETNNFAYTYLHSNLGFHEND